jgi:hypothetical protein
VDISAHATDQQVRNAGIYQSAGTGGEVIRLWSEVWRFVNVDSDHVGYWQQEIADAGDDMIARQTKHRGDRRLQDQWLTRIVPQNRVDRLDVLDAADLADLEY